MVEANELRVGNWVALDLNHSDTSEFQIELADLNLIATDKNRNYNPIPLTDEWLVKFGFEKNKNKVDIYELGRLRIWIGSNGRCLAYLIEEDTTFGHYIPVPIEYVHQLQNLYFAITGEELTIKN